MVVRHHETQEEGCFGDAVVCVCGGLHCKVSCLGVRQIMNISKRGLNWACNVE